MVCKEVTKIVFGALVATPIFFVLKEMFSNQAETMMYTVIFFIASSLASKIVVDFFLWYMNKN